MPAVIAIATAPQDTTRTAAARRGAPPSRAPTSPSSPSAISVTTTVVPSRTPAGVTATAKSGSVAPAANESADVHAAWNGRAEPCLVEAQLVAGVRPQRAAARQRRRHLARQRRREAPFLIDPGELAKLAGRVPAKLARLEAHVGLLGVPLRADRHILAGGHRERSRHQPGDPRDDDRRARRARRRHPQHEARGRQDAVVGAEHASAQPVGTMAEMDFGTGPRRAHARATVLRAACSACSWASGSGRRRRCSGSIARRGRRSVGVDQVVVERVANQLGARGEPDLLLDVRAVRLDRPDRQEELLTDLGVGVTERDQAEHLELAS